jgi:hypothetical protein
VTVGVGGSSGGGACILVLLCLCPCALWPASAATPEDGPPTLRPGIRLRVTAPTQTHGPIVGTLASVSPSTLTIQTGGDRIAIPREAIRRLEVSRRRGSRRKGALIGAGVGFAATVALYVFMTSQTILSDTEQSQAALAGGALMVPLGAALGAMVAPGERWAAVPPPPAARMGVHSQRGAQLSVSFRF